MATEQQVRSVEFMRGLPPGTGAMNRAVLVFVWLLLAGGLCRTHAQSYSVSWFKVAGGGGTSTNGQYSVSAAAGQHDAAGPMTGGAYSLTGGFWSFIAAVQTPGSPTLAVKVSSPGTLVISWSSSSSRFVLQQSPNLRAATWSNYTGTVNVAGTNRSVTISPTTGNYFFRLQYQ